MQSNLTLNMFANVTFIISHYAKDNWSAKQAKEVFDPLRAILLPGHKVMF